MNFYKEPFDLKIMTSYQTQVLDCQFQMRIVWSSEALRIHGYSWRKEYYVLKKKKKKTGASNRRKTYMVEEGGSDVIKMSKKSEETASQLVVPHLSKRFDHHQKYSLLNVIIQSSNCTC